MFALILAGTLARLPLGIALVIGAVLIDLWAGKPGFAVMGDLGSALRQPELWLLVINITLILEFGYYMAYAPNSRAIIAASSRLGGHHGRSLGLVVIPAAIGLVPMPGGALFSAPLVSESLREKKLPAAWKVAGNYWFRHVFEYWWPLYPVVIVTLSIFTIRSWQFFILQVPFTLVSLLAGWYFILHRNTAILAEEVGRQEDGEGQCILRVRLPLMIVVLCTLLLPPVVRAALPEVSARHPCWSFHSAWVMSA